VKQHLAAIRMLFDWLVIGQVMPLNPAHAVRGPRHSVKKGKTSVLAAEEMRQLLDSIETDTLLGLRDRALIGLMGYTFARVGAAGCGSMKKAASVTFPISGSDSGLVQDEWAREQQRGADERGAIRSRRGHTFAA
jgi:hypothetical protein